MSKRTMLGVGWTERERLLAVAAMAGWTLVATMFLMLAIGVVDGHVGCSTTPARAGTSSSPPARSLSNVVTGRSVSEMELGSPDARLTGGGDGGGVTPISPAPASTTVVSTRVSSMEEQPARSASSDQGQAQRLVDAGSSPAPSTPTVIISAMTPTAGSLEAQVRASVERWFPASEESTAMRVAYCESRYQPWAAEPGGAHHGLFQVADSIWGAVPSDVDSQVRQAAVVWRAGGWSQWSCQ